MILGFWCNHATALIHILIISLYISNVSPLWNAVKMLCDMFLRKLWQKIWIQIGIIFILHHRFTKRNKIIWKTFFNFAYNLVGKIQLSYITPFERRKCPYECMYWQKMNFRVLRISRKMGLRASCIVTFLHFLPNYWHIWWFFKVEHAEGARELWKIIKYVKKWRKSMLNLPSTHFLADCGYPKSDFQVPGIIWRIGF